MCGRVRERVRVRRSGACACAVCAARSAVTVRGQTAVRGTMWPSLRALSPLSGPFAFRGVCIVISVCRL